MFTGSLFAVAVKGTEGKWTLEPVLHESAEEADRHASAFIGAGGGDSVVLSLQGVVVAAPKEKIEPREIPAKPGKYLTFKLRGHEIGIPIAKVDEIVGMMRIRSTPKDSAWFKGSINLRGKDILVADLGELLRLGPPIKDTEKAQIVIVQVSHLGDKSVVGFLVDDVVEVLNLRSDQLRPPPLFSALCLGIGKIGLGAVRTDGTQIEKGVTLLDIDKVIGKSKSCTNGVAMPGLIDMQDFADGVKQV